MNTRGANGMPVGASPLDVTDQAVWHVVIDSSEGMDRWVRFL